MLCPNPRAYKYLSGLSTGAHQSPDTWRSPGIYALVLISHNSGAARLYIGESASIAKRFSTHLSQWKQYYVLPVHISTVAAMPARRHIQNWYILRHWGPRLLNRYKPVHGLPPSCYYGPQPPVAQVWVPQLSPQLTHDLHAYVNKVARPIKVISVSVPFHKVMPVHNIINMCRRRGVRLIWHTKPPLTALRALTGPSLHAISNFSFGQLIWAFARHKVYGAAVAPLPELSCSCPLDQHTYYHLAVHKKLALFPSPSHILQALGEVNTLLGHQVLAPSMPPKPPQHLSATHFKLVGRQILAQGFFCLPLDHSSDALMIICRQAYIARLLWKLISPYTAHHVIMWYDRIVPLIKSGTPLGVAYATFNRLLRPIPKDSGAWQFRYTMTVAKAVKTISSWVAASGEPLSAKYIKPSKPSLPYIYYSPKKKGGERLIMNFRLSPLRQIQKLLVVPVLRSLLLACVRFYSLPYVMNGAIAAQRLPSSLPYPMTALSIGSWDVVSMFPSIPPSQLRSAVNWCLKLWPAPFFGFLRKKAGAVFPAHRKWQGALCVSKGQMTKLILLALRPRYIRLGSSAVLSENYGLSIGSCDSSLLANIWMQWVFWRNRKALLQSFFLSYTDDTFGCIPLGLDMAALFGGVSLTFEAAKRVPSVTGRLTLAIKFLDTVIHAQEHPSGGSTMLWCTAHIKVPDMFPSEGNRPTQGFFQVLLGHAKRLSDRYTFLTPLIVSSDIMPFIVGLMQVARVSNGLSFRLVRRLRTAMAYMPAWGETFVH